MDSLGTVQAVIGAINYLYAASEKIKENGEECKRFCTHASSVMELIQHDIEHTDGGSARVSSKLKRLSNTLSDLSEIVGELSTRSLLQRTLWRGDISSRIQRAYKEVAEAVQEFNLGASIDVYRFQRENEAARKEDAETMRKHFDRILRDNRDILNQLQIHKQQMQEAMLTLHTHLPNIPDSTERRFLESGLHAIQRRSGPMKITPDAFVITSLDIIIHDDRKLGEGGFASVFEGDWRGTKVAVKLLERGIPSSAIQQEIDVWKRLRHPNILQFFGACSIADPPFMVCALKSNGDAVDYLRRNPSVNRSRLLYEASLGLVYLHQHSVIHGDLKATNILVDSRGKACLSDFGLSRIKVHSTTIRKSKPSEMQGTTRWMSPEQMSVGVTTKKTDVYSFAMTIYEVFTGLPPFSGTSDTVLIAVVCDRGMRPPRPADKAVQKLGLNDSMWRVITRCWDQTPEERLSASQLSHKLERLATAGTRSEGHHEHRPATQTPHTTQSRNKQTTSRPNLMKESQSEPAMIIIRDTSSESPEPSLESHGSSVQPPVIIFEDQYGGTRPSKKAKGKKHPHHQTPLIPPPYFTQLPTGPAPNAEHWYPYTTENGERWYPDAEEGSSKSGWLAKLIGKKKKTNNAMGPWTQMPQPVSPLYPSGSASPYSYPSPPMIVPGSYPAPPMVIPGSYSPPTQIFIPRPPVPPPLPVHRSPSPSPSTHIVIR